MGDVPADAPEHCPGTESEDAGKASSCAGCPNQAVCASGQARGPDPDVAKVAERLAGVKHKVLVLSGKGGVGKSTFTAHLALELGRDEDVQVGVMDVDVCGPSMPRVFGLEGEQVHQSGSGWSPVVSNGVAFAPALAARGLAWQLELTARLAPQYAEDNIAVMSIAFLLPNPEEAVIWRGPKKNGARWTQPKCDPLSPFAEPARGRPVHLDRPACLRRADQAILERCRLGRA